MQFSSRLAILITVTLALSGCEHFLATAKSYKGTAKVDTGLIEYAYWDSKSKRFLPRYFPSECVDGEADTLCQSDGNYGHPEIPNEHLLKANDSLSINLLHGYICSFSEWAETAWELDRDYDDTSNPEPVEGCIQGGDDRAGTRGEIVILATAFERGGDNEIKFGTDSVERDPARVVYFSGDVRETGQSLNQANLPLYGPVKYQGRPFFVRLFVVELDEQEAKDTGALLTELAKAGSMVYPPSAVVLETLTNIGSSFLESKHDDLLFQYEMVFDSNSGKSVVKAPLAVGIYAFAREQNRSKPIDWEHLCLHEGTGKIYKKVGNANCDYKTPTVDQFKHGHTYFVMQVKRNEEALEQDVFQTFASFSQLQKSTASQPPKLSEAVEKLAAAIKRDAVFDRARFLSSNLYSESEVEKFRAREAMLNALCLGRASDSPQGSESLDTDKIYYLLGLVETAMINQSKANNSRSEKSEDDKSGKAKNQPQMPEGFLADLGGKCKKWNEKQNNQNGKLIEELFKIKET